jgi:hypothetical protein
VSRFAEIAADADWLPHRLDPAGDRVRFVRIGRDARRARPFLYNFEPASSRDSCWIAGDAVREAAVDAAPCHFIFHTAFCRSTLLVHALDVEGVATGLSEPAIVQNLVDVRDSAFGRGMMGPVLDLLARPMAPGESVIVKPSNAANPLLPVLLEARPQSRVLLLFSQLPAFLRSLAKKGLQGRMWGRRLYPKVEHYAPLALGLDGGTLYELTDLQAAGLAWLAQQRHLAGLLAADTDGRFATLDSDVFNANRARTFAALGKFFGLEIDERRAQALAEAELFATHSKQRGDFAAIAAQQEAALAGGMIEEEIETIAAWVMRIAAGLPPVVPLRTSLFEL